MGSTDIDNQQSPGANQHGPAYWRSLEEYADSAEFRRRLANEFPDYDPEALQQLSRRHFLQLAGASMALAGLTLSGCRRWPREKIAPYAKRPEGHVPGETEQFATMMEQAGVAQGLLATSYDGRPVKLEGNPEHPISKGATDAFAQAAILQLYDPDRSRQVVTGVGRQAQPSSLENFQRFASGHFQSRSGDQSGSVAVLAEPSSSATRAAMREAFKQRFPKASWYEYEPTHRFNELVGLRQAFGQAVRPQYRLDQAKVIACFDNDLLAHHPASLKHARDWAKGRRSADEGRMNRLHVAESRFSVTGTNADHRLPTPSANIPMLIRALAARLGVSGGDAGGDLNGASTFIERLAKDLQAHAGEAVVAVGGHQPEAVHVLVAAINDKLNALGNTLTYTPEPLDEAGEQTDCPEALVKRIQAGEIDTLVMLGTNPVYNTPGDLDFTGAMQQVPVTVHCGLYYDETAIQSQWHLPRAHFLEAWGDAQAWDGTRSIQQPLIRPLFNGQTLDEVLAPIVGSSVTESYDLVRGTFQTRGLLDQPGEGFEAAWRQAIHDGVVRDSAATSLNLQPKTDAVRQAMQARPFAGGLSKDALEVTFAADESVHDGRFANNGWLQELPDPVTKMTWDNPALMNISDAKQRGLRTGDMIRLTVGEQTLELPVYMCPGQCKGSIALKLGYGRTAAGHVGGGAESTVGFDTYQLRSAQSPWIALSATVKAAGGTYALASTQNHHLIDQNAQWGRRVRTGTENHSGKIIREATLEHYKSEPNFAFDEGPHPEGVKSRKDVPLQIYQPPTQGNSEGNDNWPEPAWETENAEAPDVFNQPHAWGMTVDMNSCLGCNACVVACQAENNIPVVGKDEVLQGREMQWIRVDRYFKNDPEHDPDAERPDVVHQPMMCVHCENAPCEQVCPVAATVHDTEGLNVMVYNRCIGTRYCSNNCPYKVRRFNWFDYHAKDPRGSAKPWLGWPDTQQQSAVGEIKRMMFNPDVTVRMRGVMEKCTYCVQRIKSAEIEAKNDYVNDRRDSPMLNDGEVQTACQQACPTEAIVFGNLNQKDSQVSQMQRNNRAYGVLKELNTRPRTMHLAKIRNLVSSS
jgi:molybdopterin-containing oxidoreductase family iron-sulfur binding subunit